MFSVLAVAALSSAIPEAPTDFRAEYERAMPALELLQDKTLYPIFDLYVRCVADAIEADPRASLVDDTATDAMFEDARRKCAFEQRGAELTAYAHVNGGKPKDYLTGQRTAPDRLVAGIAGVRRTMLYFRLKPYFESKQVFERYVDHLSRTSTRK